MITMNKCILELKDGKYTVNGRIWSEMNVTEQNFLDTFFSYIRNEKLTGKEILKVIEDITNKQEIEIDNLSNKY